jgi:hypothetical protein
VLLALALVASGCGSKSSGSSLGTALSYVPKGAPVVVAVDTNPDGSQWQQVDKLIGKFPFGGQVKQQFKSAFTARSGIDYDKDVKPLLGNDLVIAITGPPGPGAPTPYVVAWKLGDEAAGKRLAQKNSSKVASVAGAEVYRTKTGNLTAFKDGTLVSARTQADLEAALKRAGTSDHMTEQDFTDSLGDLNKDSLVRVAGNFQALLSDPSAAPARKIKWVAALRTFGLTISAEPDGVRWAFSAKTDAGLKGSDLPLAAGPQAAPVVRRAGEVGVGLRDPAQIVTFAQSVAQVTDPAGYARYVRQKAKLGKQLGIDIDRDLIGQLTGSSAVSVALNGDFAVRADLRDPAAAEATLKKLAPRLVKVAKGKSLGLSSPKNGKGFYGLAQANGKKIVFGVVGKSFVAATDAARAAQFAGESPSVISGAKGSLVLATDARSLANAIAQQRGQGAAAQIVTGALGDLIGSVDSEAGGLTANLKLFVR